MKSYRYLMLPLAFICMSMSGCPDDDDDNNGYPYPNYLYQCIINEGGSSAPASSSDATVEFPSDSTAIDASFTNNRWLYFKVKGQVPGTYLMDPSGDLAIYNNSSNIEFYAQSGTLVMTAVDKAAKKVTGTFDDLILVSFAGDTVRIQDGTFNIGN